MKTINVNNIPYLGPIGDYDEYECPCCGGNVIVSDGYDIYGDEFNFSWECQNCDYTASVTGTVVKYQMYDCDKEDWIDLNKDNEDDADCISTDSEHYLDTDDVDGTMCLVYIGKNYDTDNEYRAIIKDTIFEDDSDKDN